MYYYGAVMGTSGKAKAVLNVGVEPTYQNLRHMLLSEAGFAVTSVEKTKAAAEAMKRKTFDVLVVGAWVSKDERDRAVRLVKAKNPKSVVVFYYDQTIDGTEAADAILNFRGDHADLVRTIQHLLARVDRKGDGGGPKAKAKKLAALAGSVGTSLAGMVAELPVWTLAAV